MRLALLTAVAFLAATAVAQAACPKAPPRAVADTGAAIVWFDRDAIYGCLRSAGRRVRLLEEGDEAMVEARVAGRFVAFGVDYFDKYDGTVWIGRVELWDLRTGRRVKQKALEHLASGWHPALRRLELRATGSMAFTISSYEPAEVWLMTRRRARRVDRGERIDPLSLRRDRGIVTWVHDGARRRARLP